MYIIKIDNFKKLKISHKKYYNTHSKIESSAEKSMRQPAKKTNKQTNNLRKLRHKRHHQRSRARVGVSMSSLHPPSRFFHHFFHIIYAQHHCSKPTLANPEGNSAIYHGDTA